MFKQTLIFLLLFLCIHKIAYSQTETRIKFTSVSASVNTGQNFTPWLNDNLTDLVASAWGSSNMAYVDVKLTLETKATITRISLYDHQGTFTTNPALIYALNGTQKTLIGTFTGEAYLSWVNFKPSAPVVADAIIIHKYGNNIPQKVQAYGYPASTTITTAPITSTAKLIPGLIQAEAYDGMLGISKETTSDTGGGQNIGYVDDNDWVDYRVNVASAGAHTIGLRVASTASTGIIEVRNAAGTVLGSVAVPNTGGWQTYTTVKVPVSLTAGEQNLRLFARKGGWNLNWFEAATSTVNTISTAKPFPGLIQAEAYDGMLGVLKETTSDAGGGQNVSYIDDNDWVDYKVNVASAGSYTINLRVASPNTTGAIEVRNSTGTVLSSVNVPNTGGWQTYTTLMATATLPAGEQTLRIYAKKGGWNFNWLEGVNGTTNNTTPVTSTAKPFPGLIQAEAFDAEQGMEKETTSDAGGGQNLGYIDDYDWVDYKVNVASAGSYTINLRVASPNTTGIIEVRNTSGAVLGSVNVPNTGGWQTYTTLKVGVTLPAGEQTLRVFSKKGGWNFNWFEGVAGTTSTLAQAVITFPALAAKTVGDAAFDLIASSTNTTASIAFVSSNSNVVSVSNATGKWRATVVGAGTAIITASQIASPGFTAAADVNQSITVAPLPTPIPAPTPIPSTAFKPLPGLVQAEAYDNMQGVLKESTSDVNGGQNVSYIDEDDWMEYKVNVASAGPYTIGLRVASINNTGIIELHNSAGAVLGSVSVPNTGGWQTYTTIGLPVGLAAGDQTLRIYAKKGGWNLNWFDAAAGSASTVTHAVLTFNALPERKAGDAPFELIATSTNTTTPITFTSSNPSIVTVSNESGKWLAKVVGSGTSNITASQAASSTFKEAVSVVRPQVVTSSFVSLPGSDPAGNIDIDPALKNGNEANRVTGVVPLDKYDVYNLNNTMYLDALVDGTTNPAEYGYGMLLQVAETYFDVRDYHVKLSQLRIANNSYGDYGVDAEWYYVPKGKFPKDRVLLGKHRGTPFNGYSNFPEVPLAEGVEISWIIRKGPTYLPKEVSLVGSYIPKPAKVYESLAKKPFENHLGTNSFVWDFTNGDNQNYVVPAKLEVAKTFKGGFRFYMDATTFEANREVYTFNPTSAGWWNYDLLFATLKENNLPALACVRGQSTPMLRSYPSSERDMEKIPVYYGSNLEDPASYKENAQLGFQTAARYGTGLNADGSDRNAYLLSKVKVQTTKFTNSDGENFSCINDVKVGLGTLTYIQHDNERDKWWKGRQGYQTGREYAANMSAFYDGHKGSLGQGVGVKDADPNMKVVTTGIALANTYFYQGMLDWCREFRGYKKDRNGNLILDKNGAAVVDFPADVIAFHNYLNNGGQQHSGSRGVAPEIGKIEEISGRFVKFTKEKLPGIELWQTEAGYDTRSTSSQAALAIGTKSQDITQADWNLRISLINWKLGIDRTMYYMLYDTPLNTDWDIYTRSGFVNNDQTPRPAADFFKQAGDLIGKFTYNRTLSTDPYILEGINGSEKVYACWIPDEVGRIGTYQLDLGAAAYAYIYTPKPGGTAMTMQKVPTVGGKVTVTVTETPIFVRTSQTVSATGTSLSTVDNNLGSFKLYPNPTSESINIELQSDDTDNKVEVKISHLTSGKLYETFTFEKTSPSFQQKLNLKSLPAGGYVIEVIQGERKEVKKFFKVK